MKKKLFFVLIIGFCFSVFINAQVQNYNWRYGNRAGLTWETSQTLKLSGLYGTPDDYLSDLPIVETTLPLTPIVSGIGSQLNTYEGCFTISDSGGRLLMYSNGSTMWNRNNVVMPNGGGLGGSPSSAQSGTIVKYPHSYTKYIAVSLNEQYGNQLYYAVVDMSLQGGLGNVTIKNNPLTGHSGLLGESVTVGRHNNKQDLWVLAVGRGRSGTELLPTNLTGHGYLNVWRMYDDSIGQTVLQNEFKGAVDLGFLGLADSGANPNGYVRFTNDSKHFAWINFGKGGTAKPFLCYGDFNNETGAISNVRIKYNLRTTAGGDRDYGYGVEFTNDSKYIYLTLAPDDLSGTFSSGVLVYNFQDLLAAPTQSDLTIVNPSVEAINPLKQIRTNLTSVGGALNNFFGAIQTGPDGRMYVSSVTKSELFVIDNPKDPVNMRMYKLETTNPSYWGLPNFAVPWFNTGIEVPLAANAICAEKEMPINFYIVDGEGYDKVVRIEVDFGDGSPFRNYVLPPSSNPNDFDPEFHISPGLRTMLHRYEEPRPFIPPSSVGYIIKVKSYDINGDVVNTTVKTIYVNPCVVKVNPFIRGEIK